MRPDYQVPDHWGGEGERETLITGTSNLDHKYLPGRSTVTDDTKSWDCYSSWANSVLSVIFKTFLELNIKFHLLGVIFVSLFSLKQLLFGHVTIAASEIPYFS